MKAVCQISSQLTKGPLRARIGLHFGAVIRARGAVFGDVVNVTARLSTTANPGEVLISQRHWGESRSHGFLARLGLHEGKTIGSMTARQRIVTSHELESPGSSTSGASRAPSGGECGPSSSG